ncbi:RNA polymerase sigma-70 factor (ECF subfamily) [Paenibacillus baekrokdamisoli]|nr:RNA polymerase sigma-70 factor (ECF subfamily) [Paenibacillus baekrokdamisoli]
MTNQQNTAGEFGEWLAALNRYCYGITRSKWDAEDLIQETCLKALPILTGLQQHANPTAFLLRTAKNLSVDHARRKQLALERTGNEKLFFQPHEDSFDLEHVMSLLVHHLSPLQCSVFLLREFYGFKASEVAIALDTTQGAVKAALHRARTAVEQLKEGILTLESAPSHSAEQASLLQAYTLAIRQSNPDALVLLALAQSEGVDAVQVIGRAIQSTTNQNKRGIKASQSSMLRFAA